MDNTAALERLFSRQPFLNEEAEVVVKKLFCDDFSLEVRRAVLAQCERDETLSGLMLKHHPDYVFPNGDVKNFQVLKRLGLYNAGMW